MTKTLLANIALGHIGSALIQSIDELSPAAQHCNRMWDSTRDAMLRQRAWNFALKRVSLSRYEAAPLFGYDSAYALPADYLLAVEWNGQEAGTGKAKFEIEAGRLLANREGAVGSDRAELKYVRREDNVTLWDASFCQAFGYALAAAIAPALSSSSSLAEAMMGKARALFEDALGPDDRESMPKAIKAQTDSEWMKAREGAGNW
ncbi:hypothetical protein UFOVP813_27 [uncultured Caudovirales phage]|uniref:Tail tubular protein Gp11 n=1 Tax=uncultured Caudovirales phage TaxID=2100421 RepID=A0A6J5NVH7_9CAUD|nr:hypothetical protein UFOVP813_27 [uncultured Caudovirales phage]